MRSASAGLSEISSADPTGRSSAAPNVPTSSPQPQSQNAAFLSFRRKGIVTISGRFHIFCIFLNRDKPSMPSKAASRRDAATRRLHGLGWKYTVPSYRREPHLLNRARPSTFNCRGSHLLRPHRTGPPRRTIRRGIRRGLAQSDRPAGHHRPVAGRQDGVHHRPGAWPRAQRAVSGVRGAGRGARGAGAAVAPAGRRGAAVRL